MPIKGIHIQGSKLADGSRRYYYYAWRGGPHFWTTDHTRIDTSRKRLPTEFMAAYETACQRAREQAPAHPEEGSYDHYLSRYRQESKRFLKLSEEKRRTRTRYLAKWSDMKIGKTSPQKVGRLTIQVFDNLEIVTYLNRFREEHWAETPSAADEATSALSQFLIWLKSIGKLTNNYARNLEPMYERPDTNQIWEVDQREAFLKDAPWQIRHAFLLALYTGQRRGDLISMSLTAVKPHHIIIKTGKSKGKKTAIVPITPQLRDLLNEIEAKRSEFAVQPSTVLFSSSGTPWTTEGFKSSFERHRKRIGLASRKTDPTFHDLRKTAATWYVIKQQDYPDILTDKVLVDMFTWSHDELDKMKRVYVNDDAVIRALTEHKRNQNL